MAVHYFLTTDVTTNSSNEKWPSTRDPGDAAAAPEGCLVFHGESGDLVPWDNPHNLVSQEVPRLVDAVVGAACLPLLFLISAPANILNMLVFWKQGLKERVNLCLFYLSLVDFLHMCHAFLCNVDRFYPPVASGIADFGPVFRFMVEYKLLGLRSLTWLSGFVSMLIACDRCFCVVSPLRSQTLLSTRSAGLILAFATVFCVAGSLVNGMRWSLPCVFDPRTNVTYEKLLTSQFYAQNRADMNVLSLFVATIQPTVYVTVIVATTIVIAVKLRSMTAWREQVSSSGTLSSREVALTRMLIAVSILYILCSTPNAVLGLGIMFVRDVNFSGRHYNLATLLIDVIEFTSYVNATFNFFIYYSLGSKYRDTLQMLFTCRGGASDKKKQRK